MSGRAAGEPTGSRSTAALGIDIGSSNTKVSVIGIGAADTVREVVTLSEPTPDDAAALVELTMQLVRSAVGATPTKPSVVGVASMAETGVPLATDGTPIGSLIRWDVKRDTGATGPFRAESGSDDFFTATGVRPSPKVPLATWAWLQKERPELWRQLARWAGAADLAAFALTSVLATDHTLAGRTMAYRLPEYDGRLSRTFDAELLGTVGLRPHQLPLVMLPGDVAGTVNRAGARRTGMSVGTPVIIAGHDHAVGAWAAGVRKLGQTADSIGTAEALIQVVDRGIERAAVAASGMSLTRTVGGDRESILAGSPSAGRLVRWWFENRLDGADPDSVLASVAALGPDPTGLLVLPYLRGRQTPAPDADARVRILDLGGSPVDPDRRSVPELTKSMFEGLALQVRWMKDELRRLSGNAPDEEPMMVLGGRGGPLSEWLRIKSAVMPGPGLRVVDVHEPVAAGAALLAAVRIGIAPPESVLPSRRVAYASTHEYDQIYTAFVTAATVHVARPEGNKGNR